MFVWVAVMLPCLTWSDILSFPKQIYSSRMSSYHYFAFLWTPYAYKHKHSSSFGFSYPLIYMVVRQQNKFSRSLEFRKRSSNTIWDILSLCKLNSSLKIDANTSCNHFSIAIGLSGTRGVADCRVNLDFTSSTDNFNISIKAFMFHGYIGMSFSFGCLRLYAMTFTRKTQCFPICGSDGTKGKQGGRNSP